MKSVLHFCIFLSIGINLTFSEVLYKAKDCRWPENVCVPIDKCSAIKQMMYIKNMTEDMAAELRETQCGYQNGTVYVCCKSSMPKRDVCGPFVHSSRVVHGQQTKVDQFPWTALLVRNISNPFSTGYNLFFPCGGSLLNKRYVLTSAHCIAASHYRPNEDGIPRTRNLTEVRLGAWNKTNERPEVIQVGLFENETLTADPVVKVAVEKYIVHEDFVPESRTNDIALLRLAKDVEYTNYIQPICLPNPRSFQIPRDENALTIMGWGLTEHGNKSDIKLYADITYVPRSKCIEILQTNLGSVFEGTINAEHFCAGGFRDACGGDSGGPLVSFDKQHQLTYYLAGIVTYGTDPCGGKRRNPGIYTNVTMYVDWILRNIEH